MSIKRIESCYATFLGDKGIDGTAMSVLIALAYCANERNDENCYPSDSYLEQLTHFSPTAIRAARRRLKEKNIINWISGGNNREHGNISNRYQFLFPLKKLESKRERYQQLSTCPPSLTASPPPPLQREAMYPTARGDVPYSATRCTLQREEPTNTGGTSEGTSERTSEDIGGLLQVLSDGFTLGIDRRAPTSPPDPFMIGATKAMSVCGVSDAHNRNIFRKLYQMKDSASFFDECFAFESEIRQGEHAGAKNLAAILTRRLKNLPNRRS